MDGTVIDSNRLVYETWYRVFQKEFNVELDKLEFALKMGMSGNKFMQYFLKKNNISAKKEYLWKIIETDFQSTIERIRLKSGFYENIDFFKKNYKIAIATGAPRHMALDHLARLDVLERFDSVIGGDQVQFGKPNPDIFLKAAEDIGVTPRSCVVVEDALMGLKAAKAAKMRCVIIKDEFTGMQDHTGADAILGSMKELPSFLKTLN